MIAVDSLRELLDEMRSMIERIDDESYAAPARGRPGGGIGGHVRHCLDHVSALLTGTRTGLCAYDRRARGTTVETCRLAAIHYILDLEADLASASTATSSRYRSMSRLRSIPAARSS